jgi:hypothetical protein
LVGLRYTSNETPALPNLNALVLRFRFEKRYAPSTSVFVILAFEELHSLKPFAAYEKAPIGLHEDTFENRTIAAR